KQAERSIASRLGGTRVPVTGRQRGDAPDIEHPTLSIEVKAVGKGKRPLITERLKDALDQARAASDEMFRRDKRARTPVVVVQQTNNSGRREHYVVLSLEDFIEVAGLEPQEGAA